MKPETTPALLREAFESQLIEEGRSSRLHKHSIHSGIYQDNETSRRWASFKRGVEFATPPQPASCERGGMLSDEEMVEIASEAVSKQTAHSLMRRVPGLTYPEAVKGYMDSKRLIMRTAISALRSAGAFTPIVKSEGKDCKVTPPDAGETGDVERVARAIKKAPLKDVEVEGIAGFGVGRIKTMIPSLDYEAMAKAAIAALTSSGETTDAVLPYEVNIGGVIFGKGVKLETLVKAAARWKEQAANAMFGASSGEMGAGGEDKTVGNEAFVEDIKNSLLMAARWFSINNAESPSEDLSSMAAVMKHGMKSAMNLSATQSDNMQALDAHYCRNCEGVRWTCEEHMDRPWGGMSASGNACNCGGAGSPCLVCASDNTQALSNALDRIKELEKIMDLQASKIHTLLRGLPRDWKMSPQSQRLSEVVNALSK